MSSGLSRVASIVGRLFRNASTSDTIQGSNGSHDIKAFQAWWNRPKNKSNLEFLQGQQNIVNDLIKPELLQLFNGDSTKFAINNFQTLDGINTWHFSKTTGSQLKSTPTEASKIPLVLVHGYLSSSMSYYKNVPELLTKFDNIYLLDLPGHGATSYRTKELNLRMSKPLPIKPKVVIKSGPEKPPQPVGTFKYPYHIESEKYQHIIKSTLTTFYVDMLEQWKFDAKLQHTKINLVGHSFGAYISFQYFLKYGFNSINKLSLVSPFGVERNLFSVNNRDIYSNETYDIDFKDPLSSKYCRKSKVPDFLYNNQFKFFHKIGPLGSWILWKFCKGRYKNEDILFQKNLFDQLYNMNNKEHNFNLNIFKTLFSPYLTAYDPVLDYYKYINEKQDNFMCIYGAHDWMNASSGQYFKNYHVNSNSGHNLMLDNPKEFNTYIKSFFL